MKLSTLIVLLAVNSIAVVTGMVERRGILNSTSTTGMVLSAAASSVTTTVNITTTVSVTRYTTLSNSKSNSLLSVHYTGQSLSTSEVVSNPAAPPSAHSNASGDLASTSSTFMPTATDMGTVGYLWRNSSVVSGISPTESSTTTIFHTRTILSVVSTIYVSVSNGGSPLAASDTQGLLSSIPLAISPTSTEEVVTVFTTATVIPVAASTTESCSDGTVTVSISSTTIISIGLNPNRAASTSETYAPFCIATTVTITITKEVVAGITRGSPVSLATSTAAGVSRPNSDSPFIGWPYSASLNLAELPVNVNGSISVNTTGAVFPISFASTPLATGNILPATSTTKASNFSSPISYKSTSQPAFTFQDYGETFILPGSPTSSPSSASTASFASSLSADLGKAVMFSLLATTALFAGQVL